MQHRESYICIEREREKVSHSKMSRIRFFYACRKRLWNCIAREMINKPEQYDTSYDIEAMVDTYTTHKAGWSVFSYLLFLKQPSRRSTAPETYPRLEKEIPFRNVITEILNSPSYLVHTRISQRWDITIFEPIEIVNVVMIVMNYPTDVNEYSYDTITY